MRGNGRIHRRDLVAGMAAWAAMMPVARRRAADGYALVLGTAQDGGIPQLSCRTPRCDRARRDPLYVTSLALVAPARDRFYLVDASPDITRQVDLIPEPGFHERSAARRPFDGIFLTHAHIGHYLGLALLGREGVGMQQTPVYCTPAMRAFLGENGPWSLLVDEGRIVFPDIPVDEEFAVDGWLSARMIPVPHRPEFSDTVAWLFRGSAGSILYLPDIDRWDRWQYAVDEVVRAVDVSLLDGSFFSADEVPGRRVEDIPHPLIPDTMDRLAGPVADGSRVVFTHFNNSNPVLDGGDAAAAVRERGFELARHGMRFPL